MGFCCRLGNEYQLKKNILYESDNFFVVPSIGQMGIEGYVLLCSKEHYVGIGNIPEGHIPELEAVLDKTKKVISENYCSDVIVFEHGPRLGYHKGGCSLDHSHLHIVPISIDIMVLLNRMFQPEEIHDFGRLKYISETQKSSYMFIETQGRKRYVIKSEFPIPSQYLRQVIASGIRVNEWNWEINPDYETFEKTIEHLKDKF
ncbi:MAG: hypothetical protein U9R34_01910 [Nanoarchaeota archaeon]|nr:hypothetical protein [Nanoarchaeota archaeon]